MITDYLNYDPETGFIRWIKKPAPKIIIGDMAGNISNGYLQIKFKGKNYFAHRLAWLIHFGKWPEKVIDHIDGNRSNNKIDNLRDVSITINLQNIKNSYPSNKSTRLLGSYPYNKSDKFYSKICVNGNDLILGTFNTAEEAHQRYLEAKRNLHEGNTL